MPATDSLELIPAGAGLIEGWLAGTHCPDCGAEAVYYLDYDATCCLACNRWIALHCPDPECAQCRCRPARPVAASAEDDPLRHPSPRGQ